MRRVGGRFQRSPESRSTVLAATVLLACLLLVALIARSAKFGGADSAPLEQDLVSATSTDRSVVFDESTGYSPTARPRPVTLTPEPLLVREEQQEEVRPAPAAKLQPEVLSNFVSKPAGPLPPGSPEQINFVQGFERLKPIISVSSYSPISYKATRGIILPAGKSWRLGSAYVALQYLRHTLQSTLPVQIWHTGIGEIDDVTKLYFEVDCLPQTSW